MRHISEIIPELDKVVCGQEDLKRKFLILLLTPRAHAMLEGVPGTAKTLICKTLAHIIKGNFRRIQMTPDVKPSDLVGTELLNPLTKEFVRLPGPIENSHIVLADEINRATPKTLAAFLEAMAEGQMSFNTMSGGQVTVKMQEFFMVLATQNPIEMAGTTKLGEAQLDRFCLHLDVDHVSADDELKMLKNLELLESKPEDLALQMFDVADILEARKQVKQVKVEDNVLRYIVDLARASRPKDPLFAQHLGQYKGKVLYGASPRAQQYMMATAKAYAYLDNRDAVTLDDVKAVAADVLRHRIILSHQATVRGLTTNMLIEQLLQSVHVVPTASAPAVVPATAPQPQSSGGLFSWLSSWWSGR